MRHLFTVFIATLCAALLASPLMAAAADRYTRQPECGAYVTWRFGGDDAAATPLHYGFMLRYDDSLSPVGEQRALPPLLAMDFDTAGSALALISGLPLVAHIAPPRHASSVIEAPLEAAPPSPAAGVVDWGLMGLGVSGVGFGISQMESGSVPRDRASQGVGATMAASLSSLSDAVSMLDTGRANASGSHWLPGLMLLDGAPPLVFGNCPAASTSHWLEPHHGQMGDLPQR